MLTKSPRPGRVHTTTLTQSTQQSGTEYSPFQRRICHCRRLLAVALTYSELPLWANAKLLYTRASPAPTSHQTPPVLALYHDTIYCEWDIVTLLHTCPVWEVMNGVARLGRSPFAHCPHISSEYESGFPQIRDTCAFCVRKSRQCAPRRDIDPSCPSRVYSLSRPASSSSVHRYNPSILEHLITPRN